MSGFQSAPHAYKALAAGNVALMKVRFDEHYAATFEEYQRLVARRNAVVSGARTEDSEFLLKALNASIEEYAYELERQEGEKAGALAYLRSISGGKDAEN
jgi:hypothetical protein